jgi:superfamily II DNA/RNA helicase
MERLEQSTVGGARLYWLRGGRRLAVGGGPISSVGRVEDVRGPYSESDSLLASSGEGDADHAFLRADGLDNDPLMFGADGEDEAEDPDSVPRMNEYDHVNIQVGQSDTNMGGVPAGAHGDEGHPPAELVPGNEPLVRVEADSAHHPAGVIKTRGDTFDTSVKFADLGLRESVLKGVLAAGFEYPTLIQARLIPPALVGRDVLGQAKTGTGKTAAFGLPLLHLCGKDVPFQALVLAPTRELAIQITEEINELGKFTPIRAMTIYGGQAVRTQADRLKKGAQIIVGTPGRVMDMVERGHLHFDNIRFAVLDEVDRMLDIGFREDIRRILEMTPKTRQTMMVSATLQGEIEKLARRHMRDAEKITTSGDSLTVNRVRQFHLPVNQWDKGRLLLHLLTHEEPAMTIVFCRLKRTVDDLAKRLTAAGIEAHAMHGDLSQGKRNRTMEELRKGTLAVVIASDLASRGIDVEGITHVVNYDLPDDPDLYVHRIGRTARAGRDGVAWSLVTPDQGELLTSIELLVNAEIPKLEYPGFQASPRPAGFRDSHRGRPEGGLRLANAPAQKPRQEPAEKVNRMAPVAPPVAEQKVDASKFPGGIVPTKQPPKRMFGKVRGGR